MAWMNAILMNVREYAQRRLFLPSRHTRLLVAVGMNCVQSDKRMLAWFPKALLCQPVSMLIACSYGGVWTILSAPW